MHGCAFAPHLLIAYRRQGLIVDISMADATSM